MPDRVRGTVAEAVRRIAPHEPLYVMQPEKIRKAARRFLCAFPGKVMYAVKTNPHPLVLQTLSRSGVNAFDVASIAEIRTVRECLRTAEIYFMHPVKSPEAIREAHGLHGVSNFVLDSFDELDKITKETGGTRDLTLFVRIALPKNGKAAIDFSSKFGASVDEASRLLAECRRRVSRIGVTFHVGSQTLDPSAYSRAVEVAGNVVRRSGVRIDVLDIGGGFPAEYPGQTPFPLEECVEGMKAAIARQGLEGVELIAEPGRALAAEGASLVARVELRRANVLYLNDGTYGGLFDAGPVLNANFKVQPIRKNGWFLQEMQEFILAGPTCDSLDMMKGPFVLPVDIGMGDWIEFKNTGAYSYGMRSDFNGFGHAGVVRLY